MSWGGYRGRGYPAPITAALVLAACGGAGATAVLRSSNDALTCVEHLTAVMRTAHGCEAKRTAANAAAAKDPACVKADLTETELKCAPPRVDAGASDTGTDAGAE